MNVLLDTHAFLWWILGGDRLSKKARDVISDEDNLIHISAVNLWEVAIKVGLGRLALPSDPPEFLTKQVALNGFLVLPIEMSHALRVYDLPSHHGDPFDRMLIAQSLVEEMPLISCDKYILNYDVPIIW